MSLIPTGKMGLMLNRDNLVQIVRYAEAEQPSDWRRITPAFLTVDLTWNCNYDCLGCIDTKARDGSHVVHKRQGGDALNPNPSSFTGPSLQRIHVDSALRFVKAHGLRGVQVMGGEPLLYPDIDDVLQTFAAERIPMEIVTNGSLIARHVDSLARVLSLEGSWLRVSINGWASYGRRVGRVDQGSELRKQVVEGIRSLLARLPHSAKDRVYVSVVAFKDTVDDLTDIANNIHEAGIRRIHVVRERDAVSKECVPGQEHVGDVISEAAGQIRKTLGEGFGISVTDRLRAEPTPQDKRYAPCPSVMLKTVLGADGWLYACSDHRGCEYARLACIADFSGDVEKTWFSDSRVQAALGYCPASHCADIVCSRFAANLVMSMLRAKHTWWAF